MYMLLPTAARILHDNIIDHQCDNNNNNNGQLHTVTAKVVCQHKSESLESCSAPNGARSGPPKRASLCHAGHIRSDTGNLRKIHHRKRAFKRLCVNEQDMIHSFY